jgi:hypothetical protein
MLPYGEFGPIFVWTAGGVMQAGLTTGNWMYAPPVEKPEPVAEEGQREFGRRPTVLGAKGPSVADAASLAVS